MKQPTILSHFILAFGLILLNFVSCSVFDDAPTPVLARYDLPSGVLDSIFTSDIPKDIRNVDNFLDKIKRNGMVIHEGNDPPEITADGSDDIGKKYIIEHDCIFDEQAPANVDSLYGKYEETIRIFPNPQNILMADISYSFVGDDDYPQFHSGMDRGSGRGYVSGNGNNFTIFYKVEEGNGIFDNIPYQAIWIVSGTVSDTQNARDITNVTKCLVMLQKGDDPGDKVANRGTIRIFRDANPDWIQPEVVISDFSPPKGPYGTIVTINGSGFGTVNDSVKVMFNIKEAKVLRKTPNQLEVEVPKRAGTGPVTVQVYDKIGKGNDFEYIPVYTVSTLAGNGKPGFLNGSGDIAMFYYPVGVAVDAGGTVYVTDLGTALIRIIDPKGEVSSLDSIDSLVNTERGVSMKSSGIAVDAEKNIYVADISNNVIWSITPEGEANVLFDQLEYVSGVAVDSQKNVYVTGRGKGGAILMIMLTGEVKNLGASSQFNIPSGVAVDNLGNVYVADMGNNLIWKITPTNVVSILGGATQFNTPNGVAVDAGGNVYVADTGNHRIRKITPDGEVTTLAGTGQPEFLDGIGRAAMFNHPSGIAIDNKGTIYVADSENHRIRKMVLE